MKQTSDCLSTQFERVRFMNFAIAAVAAVVVVADVAVAVAVVVATYVAGVALSGFAAFGEVVKFEPTRLQQKCNS